MMSTQYTKATVHQWSDADIEKLGKDVCCQLKESSNQEGGDNLLDLLRRICGKNDCDCTNLTPCQKLSRLLKVLRNDITDYSVGISVIYNYNSLAHEEHCRVALERMLMWSLSDAVSERKYHFLDQLWTCQGLEKFKIEVLEEFIYKESKYMEEYIFLIFEEMLKKGGQPERIWEGKRFERLVSWSCRSARIFCALTSVLNSWLQRIVSSTNQYKPSLAVVNTFVCKVKRKCAEDKKDFVFLYPREYHSLVSLLDIHPELFPEQPADKNSVSRSTVVELVRQSLNSRQVQTVCLLTHFPEWAPFVYRILNQ